MNVKDNRELNFLPIVNDSPKFLTTKDIEHYNSKGFAAPFNAFSAEEAINIREKLIIYLLNLKHIRMAETVILLIVISINQKLFGKLFIQKKFLTTFKI